MIESLHKLEEKVSLWPGITIHPHRFGGREFLLGRSEVGHFHSNGALDIPLPRWFRDEILAERLAEVNPWSPDSGWITFQIGTEQDVEQALKLLRLSYLRYVLKAVPDPSKRFEQESAQLNLNPKLKTLLRRFVPQKKGVAA